MGETRVYTQTDAMLIGMDDEIAGSDVICITSAGERLPVRIMIGRPTRNDEGLWECPVGLQGLYQQLSSMKSDDSFHALCLSVSLIRSLLEGFVLGGGRILIAGAADEEFPLDAYFPPRS